MKVALAFSGGLDTTICIPLLREIYDEIIGVTVDVGQHEEDLKEANERSHLLDDHRIIDAKDEFAKHLLDLVKANGNYEGYPLGTSLSRPIIAKKCLDIALEEKADAIAHGCTGKGNDQLRFEAIWRTEDITIEAPIRKHNLTRKREMELAKKEGVEVPTTKEEPWSIDSNIWSRSIEGGDLEIPSTEPPEKIYEWTKSPEESPEEPEKITIEYKDGVPTSINGEDLKPVDLIKKLNNIAGKHGIGRNDMIEDRILGLKVREIYEHPAATVLLKSHRDLESLVLTQKQLKFKKLVEQEWSELVYKGLINEPLFKDLNMFIESSQKEKVSGTVKIKLYKGNATIIGRESEKALYSEDMASFDTGDIARQIEQQDAVGFSKYHGIQSRLN